VALSRAQKGCFFVSIRAETRRPLFKLGWEHAVLGDTNTSLLHVCQQMIAEAL